MNKPTNPTSFSTKLYQLMAKHGTTLKELAGAINVSRANISRWKNGYSDPRFNEVKLIADYFKVSVSEFTGETPPALSADANGRAAAAMLSAGMEVKDVALALGLSESEVSESSREFMESHLCPNCQGRGFLFH